MSDFDENASACAIEALSVICKRSTDSMVPFNDLKNDEVDQMFQSIRRGDASKADYDLASSLNVLWCGVVLVMKDSVYFMSNEAVAALSARLPVHVQRFFGALFSTFEVLMHRQPENNYLVQSLILCVQPNARHVEEVITEMVRDYKSLFSFAYMFNRRTGSNPVSQVQQVADYFKRIQNGGKNNTSALLPAAAEPLLLEDDDNDSFDRLMRSTTDNFAAPKFSAPSVMPLRPVKLLSDDEHYGSDYQPAAASDPEGDLLYNSNHGFGATGSTASTGADQHLALLNDDSMYSMDGGSILNSYYKYNGWNNTVEEDEDSGSDHYEPPATVARTKRMTRMRQQQSAASGAEKSSKPKKHKKRTRRANKDRSDGAVSNRAASTAAPAAAPVVEEFTYKGGRFRSALDSPPKARGSTVRDDEVKSELDSKSPLSSPDNSYPAKGTAGRDSFRRHALDSDEEDSGDDDEASDYSTEHSSPQAPHSKTFTGQASASVVKTTTVATEDVEDFEPLPDEYASTTRRHDMPAQRKGRAHSTDAHSPSSAGSSIDLSDPERKGSRSAGGWSSAAPRSLSEPRVADGKGRGRMRSVLSDDDSDEGERNQQAKGLPLRAADAVRPRGNPLDASLEGPSAPTLASHGGAGRYRNPLDASVEALPQSSRTVNASDAKQGGQSWVSAGPTREPQRKAVSAASPGAGRSVVRLPVASPSKADMARKGLVSSTEGEVDLVTDWDTPEESDEEKSTPRPVAKPLSAESLPAQPARRLAEDTKAVQHNAQNAQAPSATVNRHDRAAPEGKQTILPAKVESKRDQPSDRDAAIEKMKENILRRKREKAEAAATQHPPLAPRIQDAEDPEPSLPSLRPTHLAPPAPAAVRKSVTFIEGLTTPASGAATPTTPQAAEVAPSAVPAVAPPSAAAASTRPPLPDRPPSGPVYMSVRESVDDTVLYGSRQSSVGVVDWKDDGDAEPASPMGSESSQRSGSVVSGAEDHPPSPSLHPHASAGHMVISPGVASGTELLRRSQGSAASAPLPASAAKSQTLHQDPVRKAGVALQPAAAMSAPTLSRIPSEQLLPTTSSSRTASDPAIVMAPRTISSDAILRQSSASSLSASISKPLPSLPDHFQPPPLSEFAQSSGIILEGYLHKKSAGIFGQWQKRYFVLAESSTAFCVLRIFTRAVVTAWGPAAVGLRASIPIHSIESIATVSNPGAKGKEFVIKFCRRYSSASATGAGGNSTKADDTGSDNGSVFSDVMFGSGDLKTTTLMADDAETRLLWVTILQRAHAIATEQVPAS